MSVMYLNVSVYHGEDYVNGDESPGASNASAAVNHHGPSVMYEVQKGNVLQQSSNDIKSVVEVQFFS